MACRPPPCRRPALRRPAARSWRPLRGSSGRRCCCTWWTAPARRPARRTCCVPLRWMFQACWRLRGSCSRMSTRSGRVSVRGGSAGEVAGGLGMDLVGGSVNAGPLESKDGRCSVLVLQHPATPLACELERTPAGHLGPLPSPPPLPQASANRASSSCWPGSTPSSGQWSGSTWRGWGLGRQGPKPAALQKAAPAWRLPSTSCCGWDCRRGGPSATPSWVQPSVPLPRTWRSWAC